MDELFASWVIRAGAVLMAALAGVALSRTIGDSDWRDDHRLERAPADHAATMPYGTGGYGIGCWALAVLFSAMVTGRNSLALLAIAGAIVLTCYGWPMTDMVQGIEDGSVRRGNTLLFMLLFQPGPWVLLISGFSGLADGLFWQERIAQRIRPRTDFDD